MTRQLISWTAGLVLTGVAWPVAGQVGTCSGVPYDALDFWVGDWTVETNGVRQGTNHITRILDGCAVREVWRDSAGGRGESLFYVSPEGEWRQVWVTDRATRPGGVKEKAWIELPPGHSRPDAVRFQGALPLPDGGMLLDRTTLTPLENGSVRQHIEVSRDGGDTWETTFDARYIPLGVAGTSSDQAPLGVVQAMLAAFNAHDADALAALVAPDFEYLFVGEDGLTETATVGRESFRIAMLAYFEEFPDVESRLIDAIAGPSRVAFRERIRGGDSSLAVYEIRDGLVRRAWYYPAEPWPSG